MGEVAPKVTERATEHKRSPQTSPLLPKRTPILVGGDVLDAPLQTPIANPILTIQGNVVTKPPSEREVDFAKQKTEGVCGINALPQTSLLQDKETPKPSLPLEGKVLSIAKRMRCPEDRDYIFRNPSVFREGRPLPYEFVPLSFVRKNRL